MKILILFVSLSCLLLSCNGSVSVRKDLMNGMSTVGNGLDCDDVDILLNEEKYEGNEMCYGQKMEIRFNDINGFKELNGSVFPGLRMKVINSEGTVVFSADDLYAADKGGFSQSPLVLTADLTLGKPIASDDTYKIEIYIWDKKEKTSTFKANYEFTLKSNQAIKTGANDIEFEEVYLFSEQSGTVITDNVLSKGDKISMHIQNMSGFEEDGGMVFPGLSLIISDANGTVLLESENLLADYMLSGIDVSDMEDFNFYFDLPADKQTKSPIHIEAVIWDNLNDNAVLEITTDCKVN